MPNQSSICRTPFQQQYAMELAQQPNFAHYVENDVCNEEYRGPVNFLFMDKEGVLNCHVVGQKRVLRKIVAQPLNY